MVIITDSWVRRSAALLIMGLGLLLGGCSPLAEADLTDTPSAAQNSTEASEGSSGLSLPALPFGVSITPIAQIKENPEAGQTFVIQGVVQRRVAILKGWVYQVSDDTDHLWIITQASTPRVGDTARVTGLLQYEQILVGEMDIGEYYLKEENYEAPE